MPVTTFHFRVKKEGKGYWAECIEHPGCRTQADSPKELRKNMREALDLFLSEGDKRVANEWKRAAAFWEGRKALRAMRASRPVDRMEKVILGGPETLGAAIKMLRAEEGLSQQAMAKRLGVPRKVLADIEDGRRFVDLLAAARFAKALGFGPLPFVQLAGDDSIRAAGLKLKVKFEPL